jgi:Domain of unknown function (DUF397)
LSISQTAPVWRRSTRCDSGSCVEVAYLGAEVLLRDSKDPGDIVLRLSKYEWVTFLRALKAGDFN